PRREGGVEPVGKPPGFQAYAQHAALGVAVEGADVTTLPARAGFDVAVEFGQREVRPRRDLARRGLSSSRLIGVAVRRGGAGVMALRHGAASPETGEPVP